MRTSQQVFAAWFQVRIAPALRDAGYAGGGQDFQRRFGRNWAAINVQRDRYSTSDELRFTINLGTKSGLVTDEQGGDAAVPAREIDGDWRSRIGSLTADRLDNWWVVRADASEAELEALADTVRGLLVGVAFPKLTEMTEDRAILDSAVHSGRPNAPFFLDIAAPILRAIGPRTAYRETLAVIDAMGTAALDRYRYREFRTRRPGPREVQRLLADIGSKDPGRRSHGAAELGSAARSGEVAKALRSALRDPAPSVRGSAAQSLGRLGVIEAAPTLIELLETDRVPVAAVGAGIGLGAFGLGLPPAIVAAQRRVLRRRIEEAAGVHRGAFRELLRVTEAPPA